jgi:hypothetical protein
MGFWLIRDSSALANKLISTMFRSLSRIIWIDIIELVFLDQFKELLLI